MRNQTNRQNSSDLLIRGWFFLAALTGGICLHRLASVGEPSLHAVFLGYSASRLLMMAVLLVPVLIGLLGVISAKPGETLRRMAHGNFWKGCLTVSFLILSLLRILWGFLADESFLPTYLRIRPLLVCGMILSGTAALLMLHLENRNRSVGTERSAIRRKAAFYFLIACGIYLLIRLTGIGIIPDEMDWQPNGMAIQYWEVWLSLWIAFTISLGLWRIHAEKRQGTVTVMLFLLIWAAAAVLWISIPSMKVLDHSYFMEITAPNYLPYPASDSAYYGLWAESVLAGLGFKTTIATRPFLITAIAFFEWMTGGDILKTVDCITAVLALIPACLYLLGRRLHSHGAGIFAASLAVLREYNTLWLAPHYMVSNSKMLLSDLPAMLCMLAAMCAAVDWFRNPRSVWRMLLTGCLVGFSITVRSQLILLVPFLPLFFLMQKGLPIRQRLLYSAGFLGASLLIMAPWLIRSKLVSGAFILDEPGIHSTELARRWSDDVENTVIREEGESDADYAARNKQHMVSFFFEKPLYVLKFIASHFGNNVLCAFTALPFATDPNFTVRDVTDTGFHDVARRMTNASGLPALLIFSAVISIGLSAARKRNGWAGTLPFYLCLIYLFVTACGRYSGWRFALPADWFCYFYFAMGAAEIAFQGAALLNGKQQRLLNLSAANFDPQPLCPVLSAGILILFLAAGSVPALCGKIIPQQVFMNSSEINTQNLKEITAAHPEDDEMLSELLSDPAKTVLNGRIIYPRYFYSGQGLASGHPWTAYKIRDYARLGFVLLNEENHDVLLPLENEPAFIPNAAEIYVIGTEAEDFFLADAVIIPSTDPNAAPRILISDKQE